MPSLKSSNNQRTSDLADEAARKESAEALQMLGTSVSGLSEEEAAARLEKYGPNTVAREKQHGWLERLYVAARNPLVILLTIHAIISFTTGDAATGIIILVMATLG